MTTTGRISSSNPLPISFSSMQVYLQCPRKWYLQYGLRLRAVGQARGRAPEFGDTFHKAQAALWEHESSDKLQRLQAALAAWDASCGALSWEDQYLGRQLLLGYAARYNDDKLRTITVPIAERRLELPVLDPDGKRDDRLLFKAVMDVVAYDESGNTVLVEHKTTSQELQAASYWNRVDRSQQATLYFLAAQLAGRAPSRLVWDAVRAPRMRRLLATPIEKREYYKVGPRRGEPRPGTRSSDESPESFQDRVMAVLTENPDAFYARRTLERTEADIYKAQCDLWAAGQGMLHILELEGASARNEDGCEKYGSPCAYQATCWHGASVNDEKLYTIRRNDK